MFGFLTKKEVNIDVEINETFNFLKEYYNDFEISDDRKEFLKNTINKFGYLNISYQEAFETLTSAEILYGLELKFEKNDVFKNGFFSFKNEDLSPVRKSGYKNADWIKKEQHNIKLINLCALNDGNITQETGKFIDWLRQVLILPVGNDDILATTIYLTPFHPREFECAYIPRSFEISEKIVDKRLEEKYGLDGQKQVQLFIKLAQLAGHPVIYDILPQTGRFSKTVLSNPQCVRWFNINALMLKLREYVDFLEIELAFDVDEEDIKLVKNIYKKSLSSQSVDLNEFYQKIYEKINEKILIQKKEFSEIMLSFESQKQIQKDVKALIESVNGEKIKEEKDIKNQGAIIEKLIEKGFWTAPGGALNSSGIPIFDGIDEVAGFPLFRHYDVKANDVTEFANLDCQTPFYFVKLDQSKYNNEVIDFYIKKMIDIRNLYGFDGFRIDHVDHIIDEFSINEEAMPISYRIPAFVLSKLSENLKKDVSHFAILAEYMLSGKFFMEYHQEMGFDLLWGDDISAQYAKTPEQIIDDNQELADYNVKNSTCSPLSILKTYNNQDGEFSQIDCYPSQLGEKGAIFKWFKYKFLVGGKFANRPVMYVDGDESFTQKGIEAVINNEISMKRGKNFEFFKKFDTINRFALNNELTKNGESQIIRQDDDGFVAWLISKDPLKEGLLVIANYFSPTEKIYENEKLIFKERESVFDKKVDMPCDYRIVSELKLENDDFKEIKFRKPENTLHFDKLEPAEFKIFKVLK